MVHEHKHEFERIHTRGNPYEGGTIYRKCECGIVQTASEDGTDTLTKRESRDLIEYLTDTRMKDENRAEFEKAMAEYESEL